MHVAEKQLTAFGRWVQAKREAGFTRVLTEVQEASKLGWCTVSAAQTRLIGRDAAERLAEATGIPVSRIAKKLVRRPKRNASRAA